MNSENINQEIRGKLKVRIQSLKEDLVFLEHILNVLDKPRIEANPVDLLFKAEVSDGGKGEKK